MLTHRPADILDDIVQPGHGPNSAQAQGPGQGQGLGPGHGRLPTFHIPPSSPVPSASDPNHNPHNNNNNNNNNPTPVIDTGVHADYDPLGDMSDSLRSALSAMTDVFAEAGGMSQSQKQSQSSGYWSTPIITISDPCT